MFKSNKGFTLIEIIVVLVILGIMAAAVIPTGVAQVERANEAMDVQNMSIATRCAQLYAGNKVFEENKIYYWDIVSGDWLEEAPAKPYGKGTKKDGGNITEFYDPTENVKNKYICLKMTDMEEKTYEIYWSSN